MRLRVLLLFLTACSFFTNATAQTYRLKSLDGTPVQVQVFHHSSPRALAIVCGKDTVFVYDYWALDEVKVLNRQFLQLTYAVRGGTNQGLGSTLVVCVSQRKLHQALKVPSYSQYDLYGPDYHHELYRVRLSLLGTTPQTYRFHFAVQDERRSSLDPEHNHRSSTQAMARFDPDRQLFYTGVQRVPTGFRAVDDKTEQVVTLKVPNPVPVIVLKDRVRYFIQGEWF